jgi:hypothetical protein
MILSSRESGQGGTHDIHTLILGEHITGVRAL